LQKDPHHYGFDVLDLGKHAVDVDCGGHAEYQEEEEGVSCYFVEAYHD
jgi:hypothetical protein